MSILYHCNCLVQVGHHGIIPLYHQQGFNPFRTIVLFGTGGISWDYPIVLPKRSCPSQVIVPFGTGEIYHGHCTTNRGSIPSAHSVWQRDCDQSSRVTDSYESCKSVSILQRVNKIVYNSISSSKFESNVYMCSQLTS